jgi:hypothetical protein
MHKSWLVVPLALLAALGARADGLVYQLPEDGVWAEYDLSLRIKADGQEATHRGLLRLASAGKVRQNDQPCRWIELAVTRTEPPLADEVIKVLIPEKHIRAGADLTGGVLKAWRKGGDSKVEDLPKDKLQLGIGPVSLFLAGPLQDVKKLDNQEVVVEGLGKLPCLRESGKGLLRFGKDRDLPATFTSWKNPRAPFGSVRMQIDIQYEQDGLKVEGHFEARLARKGEGAKSALPEGK